MSQELSTDDQYWKTAEGKVMRLADMESSHVFNTMKMLWNHLADEYELPTLYKSNRYIDFSVLAEDAPKKVLEAIVRLGKELKRRDDLTPYMIKGLEHINQAVKDRPEILELEGSDD